ncbi:MAG: zinc ribbon domain-containing protein [Parachlamydiaceae bacterium]|nr:zinc ribbon domain-containing protein [Parachlamydiaceae bacterium]
MPNYDYACSNCGHQEEIFQKMSDSVISHCPVCDQSTFVRKPGGGVGLQFKGSGFYITDYKKGDQPPAKGCSDCSCKD